MQVLQEDDEEEVAQQAGPSSGGGLFARAANAPFPGSAVASL